jgi:aryl-alcohol dehydrogenase-like predicted oxidoreductase
VFRINKELTMNQPVSDRISLGASGLSVSPIGVGTNRWGTNRQADPDLLPVFQAALEAGINLFDTAEIYSLGGSERTLGQFLPAAGPKAVVTTKFLPLPWRLSKGSLTAALRGSLGRLQLKSVDLYLIHMPWPPVPVKTWMDGLADAVQAGLVRAVGVSNYSPEQTRLAQTALAERGVALACNQVEFSLLKRGPERNGLLKLCLQLGVALVAYRPVAGGLLAGKYTPEAPPQGLRGLMAGRQDLIKAQQLVGLLRQMGEKHGGKTPSQVAINWVICKGALPIPGATQVKHIHDNAGAMGWRLSEDEVAALDGAEERPASSPT